MNMTGATMSRKITGMLLGLLLLLAGWLRFSGLNWDEGQHLHPDERFLTMVASAIEWPDSLAAYFDTARSPLNPRNRGYAGFVYGTLPMSLVRGVGEVTNRADYEHVVLLGRFLSAAADLATVAVCFLLGLAALRNRVGALLSAAFYGFAVLPIQHAHFFVVDSFATLFLSISLLALVWAQERSRLWRWAVAGAFWGLALACKLSIYTFLAIPVALAFWQAWRVGRGLRNEGESRGGALERGCFRVLIFGSVAFLFLRMGMPDAFRGPGVLGILPEERWLSSVEEARRLVSGEVDFPPGHQWTNRPRYWFPWKNMVLWGLGPALGLAAWAGLVWAIARLVRGRDERLLLPAAWALLLFLHQGGQWVKSMRYLLPLYPAMGVLASWLLLELHRKASRLRWRRGAIALGALVLAGTLLWALAFASIYRLPHSRVVASRWILANIPPGSAIGVEHWDDPLPLRVDGHDPFGGEYRGVEMQWYSEDEPEKLGRALDWLDQTDAIVLSSNRLYDSIPRLWMRFPMTTLYYRALFGEQIGFRKVAEFTSYPRLFGIQFPDQSAEEAFSVYDHPRVQIFRKTPEYSRARAESILSAANFDTELRLTPVQEAKAPGGLRFAPDEWSRLREGIQPILPEATGSAWGSFWRWVIWLLILGPLTAPIVFALTPALPDRGWGLARIVGLLLVSWAAWMVASLHFAVFTRNLLLVALVLLLCASVALVVVQCGQWREFLRRRWPLLLGIEGVFWVAFAFLGFIRWMNPDLWHPALGGEKPMDMAYFNAVLRTPAFPPYNPWHAGSTMNYYYFGYVPASALVKLSGAAPEVGYNLAIASYYALFASGVFCAAMAIGGGGRSRRNRGLLAAGCLGVTLAAVAGNLREAGLVWEHLTAAPVHAERWFWDATRVIHHPLTEAGPITEFPFFTFLFADLHPHLMALPLFAALLALGCAMAFDRRLQWGLMALAALVLGALWPTNAWDFPTGAVVLLGSLTLSRLGEKKSSLRSALPRALAWWAVILLAARLLYYPFHDRFGTGYGSFEAWTGSRTPLTDYLQIHGVFLVLLVAGLASDFLTGSGLNALQAMLRGMAWRWNRPARRRCFVRRLWTFCRPRRALWISAGASVAALLLSCALWSAGMRLTGLLVALLVWVMLALIRRRMDIARQTPLGLAAVAIVIGLAVEFIVLRGDISRMNTVFKFYLQAWTLLSLSGVAFVFWMDGYARGRGRWMLWPWRTVLAAFFALALIYPLLAVPARIQNRFVPDAPRGFDGLAFLEKAVLDQNGKRIELRHDLEAIRWLRANAQGLPVIAEATTHPQLYGWGARFATHTGLPAIIGWDWHERQQMAALPVDVVTPRVEDVKRMYNTADATEAWGLLRRYGAELVIVGGLEKALFDSAGIEKFAAADGVWWHKVFENEGVVIYRVATAPPPGPKENDETGSSDK